MWISISSLINGMDIPALFLSARDEDCDRLFGLGLGADDYITKPFLTQELLLRIRLILRRSYGVAIRPHKEDNPSMPQYILTVRGLGYKLAKEMERV